MSIYRTILTTALDPVLGPGAPLQQSTTISNDVTLSGSTTASVTDSPATLNALAGVPNAGNQRMLVVTNLDTAAVLDVVILKTGGGVIVATLNAGGQFMISGHALINLSTWTLGRGSIGTTLVRIEWGA